MPQIWQTLLYQPLVNALVFFYGVFGQNLGLAIIALTVAIRAVLLPLTMPSMRATAKMRELAPELGKLKKRYGNDRKRLAQEQMKLYKERGANPAAGCLPQIVQLIVLIALFQAFNQVLRSDGDIVGRLNEVLYSGLQIAPGTEIATRFFYLDLVKPDLFRLPFAFSGISLPPLPGFFLIAAALIQFLTSKTMMPAATEARKVAKKTEEKSDDIATTMQSQMLYLFPLMTLVIGYTFPSGLVLYWLVFSATMLAQQLYLRRAGTT